MNRASLPPVRILCAADAAFTAPLCVMLVSLLAHFPRDRAIEIRVLAPDIPEEEQRRIESCLRTLFPALKPDALKWLSPSRPGFDELPVSGHITMASYSRLLAPSVLPDDWDRVLYLDSDLVVLTDVSPLYDLPYDGKAVYAVQDLAVGIVGHVKGVFNYAELGLNASAPYFNAGVLLMHLTHWRKNKIAEQVLDYLNRHKSAIHYHDQGALNAILGKSWTALDPTWNQARAILFPDRWTSVGYSRAEWRRVRDNPKIMHYTSGYKPWIQPVQLTHRLMPRPGHSFYFKYLKLTPYRDTARDTGLERVIGFRAYTLLWHSLFPIASLFRKKKTAEQAG